MARTGTDEVERVRLRRLTRRELQVLRRKLRELRLPAQLHRRYQIVRAAQRAPSVPVAARQVGCDVTTAYHWVARFDASGFATFARPICTSS